MKQLLLFALSACLLMGCAVTLAPNSPYIPVTREQGQAEARVATGLGGSELQFGYQLTKRLVAHAGALSYGRPGTAKGFRSADLGLGYYYFSPNGVWRVGMHGGVAYGRGTSGSSSCFECPAGTESATAYSVRYAYGYLQPTIMLLSDEQYTFGFALRLGQTYYQQLDEIRTELGTGQTEYADYTGHTSTFAQPMFQSGYRILPWLALSSKVGFQSFLGPRKPRNHINPLVAQASVHFVVNTRAKPRP